jgi:integration host factor subunit alpha
VRDTTVTRVDLAEAIQTEIGLSKAESALFVEAIIGHMADALAAGENVKISGFGSFILSEKAPRVGSNPKTGVEAPITARRTLSFRASQSLKNDIVEAS